EISPAEAGPLMCPAITTFNSLPNGGARGGDTVAILGIGGLGHLAVQFASRWACAQSRLLAAKTRRRLQSNSALTTTSTIRAATIINNKARFRVVTTMGN